MKQIKKHIILVLVALLVVMRSFAQTTGSKNVSISLPTLALIDIEPAGSINLSFSAPSEAGAAITNPPANTAKWLNYTSAIATGNPARTITVEINTTVPGVVLKLSAAAANGGGGTLGTTTGEITLSTIPQNIITGIGGAFTGDGSGNGHQLTIKAEVSDYALLRAQANTSIQITYTISGN